jgi:hypothetical protein
MIKWFIIVIFPPPSAETIIRIIITYMIADGERTPCGPYSARKGRVFPLGSLKNEAALR